MAAASAREANGDRNRVGQMKVAVDEGSAPAVAD